MQRPTLSKWQQAPFLSGFATALELFNSGNDKFAYKLDYLLSQSKDNGLWEYVGELVLIILFNGLIIFRYSQSNVV